MIIMGDTPFTHQLMPKRLVKSGSVYVSIYKVRIDIYIMVTSKDVAYKVRQLCRKNKVSTVDVFDEACGYTATFNEDPAVFSVIYCMDCMDINTITHETDHLRAFIMDYKAISGDEESATLSGFLNEEIFKFLKKHNIEIK